MTSEVLTLGNGAVGPPCETVWLRRYSDSGEVLYAGFYGIGQVPAAAGRSVKVVFPLPNGNAQVFLTPSNAADGSMTLTSAGRGFGEPGFYFTVREGRATSARYVRALQESIRVFRSPDDLRADHRLTLFRIPFLNMHYRLRRARLTGGR